MSAQPDSANVRDATPHDDTMSREPPAATLERLRGVMEEMKEDAHWSDADVERRYEAIRRLLGGSALE